MEDFFFYHQNTGMFYLKKMIMDMMVKRMVCKTRKVSKNTINMFPFLFPIIFLISLVFYLVFSFFTLHKVPYPKRE